jgi:hypothetical protein
MMDMKDFYTERLINGKIVRVITHEDLKRYKRSQKKLMEQGTIRMDSKTKKQKYTYQYYKSFGGFPFKDNNSLLKIDVNLFS